MTCSFNDFGMHEKLIKAIEDMGYTTPTPIQEQAIPYVLQGKDVLGIAQTGTGKTAGFTLPMIEILHDKQAKARMPRSLVVSPTRELAAQILDNFKNYSKYTRLSTVLLVGGESIAEQTRVLSGNVDVLICTPGRLLDLFERGHILLNDIKIFVIDEADRMLDMGFIPDLERIAGLLPPIRQTLMFSATMPPPIEKLAQKFMSFPKRISVTPSSATADTVTQEFYFAETPQDKRHKVSDFIKAEKIQNALVFCNRKKDISAVKGSVVKYTQEKVGELHGDMSQPERTRTLESFKKNDITVLICSDVAARGLDIKELSHVINFDIPHNAEDYVHRVGRTGRAGKSGKALTLVAPTDEKYFDDVIKMAKQAVTAPENFFYDPKKGPRKRPVQRKKTDDKPATKPADKQADTKKPTTHLNKHGEKTPPRIANNQKLDDNAKGFGDDVPSFFKF